MLVTHVDEFEGGCQKEFLDDAFAKTVKVLNFSKSELGQDGFTFRGRELKQPENGDVEVMMRNYATTMKPVTIERARRKQPEAAVTEEEEAQLMKVFGELQWITRQLCSDLAFQTSAVQSSRAGACVGDLVKMNQAEERTLSTGSATR
ncbi:unnamed protein product [Polarella glacialis]|uniref:Uncharacterized protein n=1 Tax=Polarella glacialis TaxID=89957 RepID=A0A813DZS1_POLGL|nr:unnamed protein product [Polarella glacialis]